MSAEPTEEIRRQIERFMGVGRSHGLESDLAIAQYVALCFELGSDWMASSEVEALLREPGIHPDEQVELLVDFLSGEVDLEELIPFAVDEGDEECLAELRLELNPTSGGV